MTLGGMLSGAVALVVSPKADLSRAKSQGMAGLWISKNSCPESLCQGAGKQGLIDS